MRRSVSTDLGRLSGMVRIGMLNLRMAGLRFLHWPAFGFLLHIRERREASYLVSVCRFLFLYLTQSATLGWVLGNVSYGRGHGTGADGWSRVGDLPQMVISLFSADGCMDGRMDGGFRVKACRVCF